MVILENGTTKYPMPFDHWKEVEVYVNNSPAPFHIENGHVILHERPTPGSTIEIVRATKLILHGDPKETLERIVLYLEDVKDQWSQVISRIGFLTARHNQLEAEIPTIKASIDDVCAVSHRMIAEVKRINEEIERVKSAKVELEEATRNIAGIKYTLGRLDNEDKAIHGEMDSIRGEIDNIHTNMAAHAARTQLLERTRDAVRAAIETTTK